MKVNKISAGILIVAATFFASCNQHDAELKSDVSTAVKNDDVNVDVKDGVVTLKGEVNDPAAKARAEARARDVKGVKSVDNEITIIAPPAPPTPEAGTATMSPADEKLYREVQAVLTTFPDVRANVHNGVVTLTGEITRPGLLLLKPKIEGLFPKDAEYNITIK